MGIHQGRCVAVREKDKTTIEEIANLIITGKDTENSQSILNFRFYIWDLKELHYKVKQPL